ncbi:Glycerol-3-phosphate acyltransferase 1 [Platanthera guangdongensis]|uniref:Glycerol-3-phosphate acyltransferase 1 n=1 Tax=Platanthera guangdongensis TaxID=2320717 RepID=A0ABR2MWA3_9ASPA
MAILKISGRWLCSGKRLRSFYTQLLHKTSSSPSSRSLQVLSVCPYVGKCSPQIRELSSPAAVACDFETTLLTTDSFFPFFMLLAFEGGGLLRAFLLLLTYPLLSLVSSRRKISFKIMAFVTFCGLCKKDVELVARAVLPKFFLENLDARAYEVWAAAKGRRAVVAGLPRVMVEWFLKEYLGARDVYGAEMKVFAGRFYTGVVDGDLSAAGKNKVIKDIMGDVKPDIGLVSFGNPHDQIFVSNCKQVYLVNKDNSVRAKLPRDKYPKPLIFHDGRLAFLPTPAAMLALFLWLPLGLLLFTLRAAAGILPYKLAKTIGPLSGFRLRVDGTPPAASAAGESYKQEQGVLYVCNHRTLLDPLMLSLAINRQLTAVTYSLSPISELFAPIRTARLTRDRKTDAEKISNLLKEGHLAVCPEGTTCREPYLLRFSALFAELADEMVPVAVDADVSMFYGTTASGFKCLDPVFFLMNPRPMYVVRFLDRVPPEMTCAAGCSPMEVANGIQRRIAGALGFKCTALTRKDKYLMLAGNEGVVAQKDCKKC